MLIFCEDRLRRQFQEFLSNDDVLSRIRSDSFKRDTFYEKLLLHSKHYCRAATSPEQLVRLNSYLFEAATSYCSEAQLLFQNNFFSAVVISKQLLYLEQKFYRPATSREQIVLYGSQFVRAITIQEDKFAQTIDIYRRVSFSKQSLLQNIKFFRIVAFSTKSLLQKRHFFRTPTIPEVLLLETAIFQKTNRTYIYIFRRATFPEQLLSEKSYFYTIQYFRRGTFSQLHFLSTATLPIYQ